MYIRVHLYSKVQIISSFKQMTIQSFHDWRQVLYYFTLANARRFYSPKEASSREIE